MATFPIMGKQKIKNLPVKLRLSENHLLGTDHTPIAGNTTIELETAGLHMSNLAEDRIPTQYADLKPTSELRGTERRSSTPVRRGIQKNLAQRFAWFVNLKRNVRYPHHLDTGRQTIVAEDDAFFFAAARHSLDSSGSI